MPPLPSAEVLAYDEFIARYSRPRSGRLVFTNGCFDILHRGHVDYLHAARQLGDTLIVAVNSDASVRRLKGAGRPINPQDDRAAVLAALAAVDSVTIFDADTPIDLICRITPDVLAKGGDYCPADIVGAKEVTAAGGEVNILPFTPGRSSTDILNRISNGISNE